MFLVVKPSNANNLPPAYLFTSPPARADQWSSANLRGFVHLMYFIHSVHSRRYLYYLYKQAVFKTQVERLFNELLRLANVAIGSFHAPFERVYSCIFYATEHMACFTAESTHHLYLYHSMLLTESLTWKKECYAIMSVVLWCLTLKKITQLIKIYRLETIDFNQIFLQYITKLWQFSKS